MEKKIKQHDFDRLVRRKIMRGMKLGYTPDDVIEAIQRITEQGFDTMPADKPEIAVDTQSVKESPREYVKPSVAVIECSLEQSWDMCTELKKQLDYEFFPVVLDTMLNEGRKLIQYLGDRTVFVTTPFHFSDVNEILKEFGKLPLNLDLSLNKDFLKVLKNLSKYKVIGILARDEDSLRAATSLALAYLKKQNKNKTRVITALIDDKESMDDMIKNAELVIHAPNCRTEANEILPWGVKKLETVFDIDQDSINEMKDALAKIRY